MSSTSYDVLLARMPEIAKAVNAFESPEAQQSAFALLVQSLGVSPDNHVATPLAEGVPDAGSKRARP